MLHLTPADAAAAWHAAYSSWAQTRDDAHRAVTGDDAATCTAAGCAGCDAADAAAAALPKMPATPASWIGLA